ncbi:uncharacterized protein NEMAJ01_1908 [Nematocida major]|uniref:uncharacterized protein n=1 Tax=Nematocida major TaxID=1912982 RepID=UPI00200846DE|nr:uncharacterized protein NEMAJ01_1908 [Nematocida major]KAH9387012.1 hypothetical protein NEMAJ01_1908 [Nematocida major]
MFYPDVFLYRDSLLYRMYVHSCMKRASTAVPVESIRECLEAVLQHDLSLRLQSKLMVSIVNTLLLHYKSMLSSIVKSLAGKAPALKPSQNKVSASVTCPYNLDILCRLISKPRTESLEEVECVRGGSSISVDGITVAVSGTPSEFGPGFLVSGPAKRVKLDRSINIAYLHVSVPPFQREKWYSRLVKGLVSVEEGPDLPGDISSIEAVRRYSSDRSADDLIFAEPPESAEFTQISSAGRAPAPGTNPRISEFIGLLYEISEGKASAVQAVPYGRIIRI